MEEALADYDLHIEQSTAEDREPIDFEIKDNDGKTWAAVWGSWPIEDVEVECEHPATEFDDDEHVGECPICGAWATWHWEEYSDDGYLCKERVVDSYEPQKKIGGIVGKYLKELQERW